MARTIEEQLRTGGKVSRGYLGLYAQDVTSEMVEPLGLKEPAGVVIAQVEENSPAEKAGLKVQDVILEINGKKITSYDVFRNEVAMLKPGSRIELRVLREGKSLELTAALGERPAPTANKGPSAPAPEQALGLTVQDLTKDLADQFGYRLGEGVIVSDVTPDSPAAQKGIQQGDLIVSVNRRNVASVREFTAAVQQSRKNGRVLLLVKRGDVSQFVVVTFE
jgi:serine protease Do